MKSFPALLGVAPEELDPITVLTRHPVRGLLVAAGNDKVTSSGGYKRQLSDALAPGSHGVVVACASHVTVAYSFNELKPLLRNWLTTESLGDRSPAPMRAAIRDVITSSAILILEPAWGLSLTRTRRLSSFAHLWKVT